jgi:phage terminase large subunit-like protein
LSAAAAAEIDDWPRPQPGPQTTFANCDADIAIFGGSAGGGKSRALLYEAGKWTQAREVRAVRSVVFRRQNPELTGGGGLWDESQAMYSAWGGRPRASPWLDWTFESGGGRKSDQHRVEFRHLQFEDTVEDHKSRQYAVICFDQLETFTRRQFFYMLSRARSTSGVKPRIRASCNPDPDSFVFGLVQWWIGEDGYAIHERSGVLRWFVALGDELEWFDSRDEARAKYPRCWVGDGSEIRWFDSPEEARIAHPRAVIHYEVDPLSLTFVLSRGIYDNPALMRKDPRYVTRLSALSRVDRARLLGDPERGGNWLARESSGTVFRRNDFKLTDHAPSSIIRTVRFWDKASSEPTPKHPDPDWTRGARVSLCRNGELYIDDLVSVRARPVDVLRIMRDTADADGKMVSIGLWQDVGGAGLVDVDTTRAVLGDFSIEIVQSFGADTAGKAKPASGSSRAKRQFANAWAPDVEAGRVYLKRALWNIAVLDEADRFPDAAHDDAIDAISGAKQLLGKARGITLLEAMERMRP